MTGRQPSRGTARGTGQVPSRGRAQGRGLSRPAVPEAQASSTPPLTPAGLVPRVRAWGVTERPPASVFSPTGTPQVTTSRPTGPSSQTTGPLPSQPSVPPSQPSGAPPSQWGAGPPIQWGAGPPIQWGAGPPGQKVRLPAQQPSTGPQIQQTTLPPQQSSTGPLPSASTGPPSQWTAGPPGQQIRLRPQQPSTDPLPNPSTDPTSEQSKLPPQQTIVRSSEEQESQLEEERIPTIIRSRPADLQTKQGTTGNPIELVTNYYRVAAGKAVILHQYHVAFDPDEETKRIRNIVVRHWSTSLSQPIGYMFDGANALYTTAVLQGPINYTFTDAKGKIDPINVSIKYACQVHPGSYTYITFFNRLVNDICKKLQLVPMRGNYYDREGVTYLREYGLELWPGLFQAIEQHENSLLMCVDAAFKVVRSESVFSLMNHIRQTCRGGGQEDVLRAWKAELVGTIVMVTFNSKTYRVDDIDMNMHPTDSFINQRTGQPITYKDHYLRKCGVEITCDDQPMLISYPTKRDIRRKRTANICLVPELCQTTGLSDSMRSNFKLMESIGKVVHAGPSKRVEIISGFMDRMQRNPDIRGYMRDWALEVDNKLVKVKGRVLPPQRILVGSTEPVVPEHTGDFTMGLRSKHMLTCAALREWVIILPARDERTVGDLINKLKQVSRPMNFTVMDPKERICVDGRRTTDFTRAIEGAMNKYGGRLNLIFVVLPNNRIDNYAAIKHACYAQYGIASQCFLARNLTHRGLMSIATKVSIQMNAKLGGEPWGIQNPLKDAAMFVGFDVYHAGVRDKQHKSVGAMAATLNRTCSRYFSVTSEHDGSQELSENIGNDLAKCLLAYKQANNGELPQRIFFYRDGVGEGQLAQVFNQEVNFLRAKLREIYAMAGLEVAKLTFIVVTKRINTRLFLSRGSEFDNPKPGTIVDDVVTKPERYDFFLISQIARQGTVSPTHYNVLYDNKGLPADRLQQLTYKLCSGYFNWSGTVSVPAPCQYAHKLAYMVGLAVKSQINHKLSNYLFYL